MPTFRVYCIRMIEVDVADEDQAYELVHPELHPEETVQSIVKVEPEPESDG